MGVSCPWWAWQAVSIDLSHTLPSRSTNSLMNPKNIPKKSSGRPSGFRIKCNVTFVNFIAVDPHFFTKPFHWRCGLRGLCCWFSAVKSGSCRRNGCSACLNEAMWLQLLRRNPCCTPKTSALRHLRRPQAPGIATRTGGCWEIFRHIFGA